MLARLDKLESRFAELNELLSRPEVVANPRRLREVAKERTELEAIVAKYHAYKALQHSIADNRRLLEESDDRELRELAAAELQELEARLPALEEELKLLLVPRDPADARNAIMEIRAGTGGDEAGLFAGDLYRMYTRFAERQGWQVEVLSSNAQGIGGFKEIIFQITGTGAYGKLKYEGGVHRVQRVPITEQSGRIHTSAASVAVLPEAEEVDIAINPNDLRIDVFRSSGPGGQSVNTTDSAVRITHLPSGLVVQCQDEKSQLKNKNKALRVLRSRLLEMKQSEERARIDSARKQMVGSGDRSDKIRTYNFPQNRVTDHRIGLTVYRLEEVLDGNLEEFIEQLALAERSEKLKQEV
ncbi:MAG: peptide chain release factor 1 [candidate division KSB1 bacterium]|nr:peptide chain release factor 1 [candidate division KSB1 bacterium]MDZ7274665.1 peptide chain release factor 1 [candidate division KSB1 bacterium]MDZ7285490.1 peptide chain release factor 1 [candidate division KSB1 bacterium]MDZ7298522.1 peptide chain release factor 1 [candidate division KSB1 bacterium]MDZ7306254.1 peptide chain release factor 1 [candidate division KSB1 bacterium]